MEQYDINIDFCEYNLIIVLHYSFYQRMGRKTKFNPKWLEFKDSNNDRVGLYITSTEDKYRPKCTWRSCEVDISSRGFLSIKDHAKAKKT